MKYHNNRMIEHHDIIMKDHQIVMKDHHINMKYHVDSTSICCLVQTSKLGWILKLSRRCFNVVFDVVLTLYRRCFNVVSTCIRRFINLVITFLVDTVF